MSRRSSSRENAATGRAAPRTLRPRRPTPGAERGAVVRGRARRLRRPCLVPRIEEEDVGRPPGNDPGARGRLVIDALLARVKRGDIRLQSAINRFEVRVSENGDTWIERLRW